MDAASCGVRSGSTLFALSTLIKDDKTNQPRLRLNMDLLKDRGRRFHYVLMGYHCLIGIQWLGRQSSIIRTLLRVR